MTARGRADSARLFTHCKSLYIRSKIFVSLASPHEAHRVQQPPARHHTAPYGLPQCRRTPPSSANSCRACISRVSVISKQRCTVSPPTCCMRTTRAHAPSHVSLGYFFVAVSSLLTCRARFLQVFAVLRRLFPDFRRTRHRRQSSKTARARAVATSSLASTPTPIQSLVALGRRRRQVLA